MKRLTFEEWINRVDDLLQSAFSLSMEDINDCPYSVWQIWYDAGVSPRTAAKRAIHRIGGDSEEL